MAQVSQQSVDKYIEKCDNAILSLEEDFLYYPDKAQQEQMERTMRRKFHIPNLYLGVDGTHIRFSQVPRDRPDHTISQHYINRKHYYSVNAMIVCNEAQIVHVDCRWPGQVHD